MAVNEGNWQYFDITENDWSSGWRRTLPDAVDAFLAREDPENTGEPIEITIRVRRRSANPIHDYIVDR